MAEKLYLVKGDTARFLREFGGLALTELTSEEIEKWFPTEKELINILDDFALKRSKEYAEKTGDEGYAIACSEEMYERTGWLKQVIWQVIYPKIKENLLKKLKEVSEPCDTNLITHTEKVNEK